MLIDLDYKHLVALMMLPQKIVDVKNSLRRIIAHSPMLSDCVSFVGLGA